MDRLKRDWPVFAEWARGAIMWTRPFACSGCMPFLRTCEHDHEHRVMATMMNGAFMSPGLGRV